jgi:branched-chain amino acid aminotransferase
VAIRVCIDGAVVEEREARVSVFDRGFLYGDSVFEVLRTYGGEPFGVGPHLERLERSAERVLIPMPAPREVLAEEIARTLAAAGNEESYVRVVITRGTGPLTLDPTTAHDPLRVVIVGPLALPSPAIYREGVSALLVRSTRPADHTRAAGAKASNYLANMLAAHEARQAGAQEAILIDPSGEVLEGATNNVFVAKDGVVRTPPLDLGILGGITRAVVIAAAARAGVQVQEVRIAAEALAEADEVFVTSSIREVVPVVRIDGRDVGDGRPGPLTARLRAAFHDAVRAELAASH